MAGCRVQTPSALQDLMAGREAVLWRPRMDMQSTSAATYTAHPLPRYAPALAPQPPPQAPMDCISSYQARRWWMLVAYKARNMAANPECALQTPPGCCFLLLHHADRVLSQAASHH